MSLHPQPIGPIPTDTERVARAAFPKGNPALLLRDELGVFHEDASFAPLFPARGQPAEAPWRLALVTVLQFAEGLSDRQAADAVRSRIDWKYLLGLELTDPGFDFSVLCEFRDRLRAGAAEQQLLDALSKRCQECGLLQARGRQRSDSTHVLAAIRTLNRLECVGETPRSALNSLATVAPEWPRALAPPEWFDRYGPRFEEARLPKGKDARSALAEQIGADGFQLLGAIYSPTAPAWLREVPAVGVLRRVWLYQYYVAEDRVRWRTAADLAPAGTRIDSPYDPEASFGNKRSTTWTGYKVHVTETCAVESVHLITHVATTPAGTADVDLTAPIHTALAAKELLPNEHLLDAGYVDAELLVISQVEHEVRLVGPVRPDVSWQARSEQGFAVSPFTIDWDGEQAICPNGRHSVQWQPQTDQWGNDVIHIAFARRDCQECPSRSLCTRATTQGREMTLRPRAYHEALQAARQQQQTSAWQAEYAVRAGIEGTLSQGVRSFGLRQCRYRGLAKTRLQHLATAAAVNLARIAAWLAGIPQAKTRTSCFARLALAG